MSSTFDLRRGIETWLTDFERTLATSNHGTFERLFADPACFRDNGAFTWDFRQFHGRQAIATSLFAVVDDIKPTNFQIAAKWPAPEVRGKGPERVVEVFFSFDTAAGVGVGVLNGRLDDRSRYGFTAYALYTRLENLSGVEAPEPHPRGQGFTPHQPGETWAQHRDRRRQFYDGEPEVLIVGAGQAGLITAVHLARLGVRALIVDANERVGDNWRKRYDSLALHNPIEMNGFPYLPFPAHYPEYLPKDVVADWLEIYARYFDLDIWQPARFLGAHRDDASERWQARIATGDGHRILRPAHIVLATGGIGGKPIVPNLPGLSSFSGAVLHSSAYTSAADYSVDAAAVVGVGSSGHDIALDLCNHGVDVTMIQRSPVIVNNVETANLAYASYFDGTPADLVDLRYGIGLISPLRIAASKQYHQMAKKLDADLLQGLHVAGMRLSDGHNGAGWLDSFLRVGGRYYLNVGASEKIIDGAIKVMQADDIDEFISSGIRLKDGATTEVDLIVLATGYQNRKVEVAEQFGDEMADRVGDIARLNDEGEWANMWCQTAQRGLWFNGGGINQVRPGSQRLALLIKADLDGLIPPSFRRSRRTTN